MTKEEIDSWIERHMRLRELKWENMIRPETFEQAIVFFEFVGNNGFDCHWSIKYWGFGEHFTFWLDGFYDFGIDEGTPITWGKMKEIILESAQAMHDYIAETRPHLLKKSEEKKRNEM